MSEKRLYNCAGRLHKVSKEQYRRYKKEDNHHYYLKRIEDSTEILSFDALDTTGFIGENIDVDLVVNVEEIALRNIEISKLRYCLTLLNDDELYMIKQLVDDQKSERELAKILGISHTAVGKRWDKLKQKLKDLLNK